MRVEEVILRAVSKQLTFWQAAQILRYSPRHLRRVLQRYRRYGFDGLLDRRKGRPSAKRMPWTVAEQVLHLYREKYFDFSVRHFHEKLREEHGIAYGYTCIKLLLQGAGLVSKARQRGPHRRQRERRPMAGMLLHIDASSHRWLGGEQRQDLMVILDDASSEIYYAQLVEEESTVTALAALRAVVEQRGIFCALYSDRGSHFWLTPKAGEPVDRQRLTQVGRAMRELHIEMFRRIRHKPADAASAVSAPGKDGCRKSCGCAESTAWKKPTVFCGRTTSRSSTVNFPSPQRSQRALLFRPAEKI